MSGEGWRERERVLDDLHETLRRAQEDRHLRQDVPDGETEPGWVLHERLVMHDRVNVLRARRGLGPAKPADLARAESLACGHVDYTQKFALHCAEIVGAAS